VEGASWSLCAAHSDRSFQKIAICASFDIKNGDSDAVGFDERKCVRPAKHLGRDQGFFWRENLESKP